MAIPITTSATSISLKNAMKAKGNYPLPMDFDTIYVSSVKRVVLGTSNSGLYRVMINNNDYTDLLSPEDATMSRGWTKNDLVIWATSNYTVNDYTESTQGANTTISFRVNGVLHSGTANNEAAAIAAAVLSLLA